MDPFVVRVTDHWVLPEPHSGRRRVVLAKCVLGFMCWGICLGEPVLCCRLFLPESLMFGRFWFFESCANGSRLIPVTSESGRSFYGLQNRLECSAMGGLRAGSYLSQRVPAWDQPQGFQVQKSFQRFCKVVGNKPANISWGRRIWTKISVGTWRNEFRVFLQS